VAGRHRLGRRRHRRERRGHAGDQPPDEQNGADADRRRQQRHVAQEALGAGHDRRSWELDPDQPRRRRGERGERADAAIAVGVQVVGDSLLLRIHRRQLHHGVEVGPQTAAAIAEENAGVVADETAQQVGRIDRQCRPQAHRAQHRAIGVADETRGVGVGAASLRLDLAEALGWRLRRPADGAAGRRGQPQHDVAGAVPHGRHPQRPRRQRRQRHARPIAVGVGGRVEQCAHRRQRSIEQRADLRGGRGDERGDLLRGAPGTLAGVTFERRHREPVGGAHHDRQHRQDEGADQQRKTPPQRRTYADGRDCRRDITHGRAVRNRRDVTPGLPRSCAAAPTLRGRMAANAIRLSRQWPGRIPSST